MAIENYNSIRDFRNNSFGANDKTGFATTNKFFVELIPGVHASDELKELLSSDNIEMLQWNLISCDLPNRGLQERSTPFSHLITTPTAAGNVTLKFYESNDLDVKRIFNSWLDLYANNIHHDQYRVKTFFEDFIINIKVIHLKDGVSEGDTDSLRTDEFFEAFPVDVGNINYSIASENQLGEISITFKYLWHKVGNNTNTNIYRT